MKPDPPTTSLKRKEYGAIVSLILAAIGLPTTLIAFFQQFVTEHVVLTTILIVVYEFLVFIFGFVNNIWEILAKKWTPDIAHWIDGWVQQTISSYPKRSSRHQKEYYNDLKKLWNDLDTRGIIKLNRLSPIPFHEGFVHLYLEMNENPHNSSSSAQVGDTIWHYLADKDKAFERLIITGPAIIGKTTLLKHTTLALATRKPPPRYRYQFRKSQYIPFLLSLREQIEAIELGSKSLVDVLNEQLKKRKCQLPEDWITLQLNKKRCLILLDGLDTLRNQELRDKAIGWIEKQVLDFDGNRFIVTSNEFAIRNNTSHHFTTVKLRPFQPEQARLLVESWLMYDKKNGRPGKKKYSRNKAEKLKVRKEAEGFLRRLNDDPVLRTFTHSPLLLTMITIVYCENPDVLREGRSKIYEKMCERFSGIREGLQQILSSDKVQIVLQELAYHMMLNKTYTLSLAEMGAVISEPLRLVNPQIAPSRFIDMVVNTNGLMMKEYDEGYTFTHRAFQQYLAAAHIKEKKLEQQLVDSIVQGPRGDVGHGMIDLSGDMWYETIRLYCAQSNAMPIIKACLGYHPFSEPLLKLADDCYNSALQRDESILKDFHIVLNDGLENPDPDRQHAFARFRINQRLQKMIHIDANIYMDTSFITCAEYQLFLDEERNQRKFHQPDHWKESHFPTGEQSGNTPILGIRRSDANAFCYWLTEHEHDQWQYRLPTTEEIANARKIDVHGKPILNAENNSTKPTTPALLDELPAGTGYWTDADFSWTKESQVLETSFLRAYYKNDLDQPDNFLERVIDNTISVHPTHCLDLDYILSSIQRFATTSDLPGTSTAPVPLNIPENIAISKYSNNLQTLDTTLNWRLDPRQSDKRTDDIKAKRAEILQYLREVHDRDDTSKGVQQKNDTGSFPWIQRLFHRDRAIKQESPGLIEAYAEGYFALALLDARLAGTIPPCEGILIVKERKSDNILQ